MSTTQKDFDALQSALEKNQVEDLKKLLQNFDLTATDEDGWNCLMFACWKSKSPEAVKVVFDKIDETAGPDLLKSQLVATDTFSMNCLMLCATSDSPEVAKVILEKIEETGGPDLFKTLLAATNKDGRNCLMLCGGWSKSPEVMKLILKKIEETGGPDLLKTQFTATDIDGRNCIMLCCECSSSPEVVKLILEKIDETGGPDLLKSQFTATANYDKNCLMLGAMWSESPEIVKVVLQKIDETGGPDLFKSLLAAIDNDGRNCLMLCGYYSSSAVMKLFAAVLFHFDLFKEQFAKLDDYQKNRLKRKTGIDSSSWVPDDVSLAEVKAILQGADATAAKKKTEEEAAAKKKAEEKAAAAKQKAEEEAALAKKKAEEEAAAKKKAEEEAAAKKKAEEEAAAKKKLLILGIPRIQKSTLNLDLNAPAIGSGATCSVYSCPYCNTNCAAKIFHSHITSDKALQREMNAAVHLKHPNIVNVLAIIVDDADKSKIMGILMQRMNGTLLQRVTNAPPFDQASTPSLLELIKWCSQTASAILCAHSLKCIHCDIKPENVMLDSHGNAHLTDFGSAHVISTAATKVTSVRGTTLFIAPEYAAGDIDGPNEKTDVFSFGMLMWVVFHPQADHGMGKNEVQIGRSLDRGKRPEINKTNVPSEIVSLIEKCWHEDADERPAMADALIVFNEVVARIEKTKKAASSVFKLTPSPLWTDGRFLKSKYGTIADHLSSLMWNTRADAPSLHFSEDITDKNSPLFKFIESKFRPSPGFKKSENNKSDTHFSGKFSRLQMVQPADAHHLFLALHEADGSSRFANTFLRHKNNSDSASQNALEKLKSVFEDPDCNPLTNNANFSRILFGWHGTNASIAEKVCRDGPRSLRLTDAGFFGAGSYFSLEADYAANYAYMSNTNSKGEYAIILFAVSVSQTYPITLQHDYRSREDLNRPEMHGFSNFYNGPDPKKAIALAPKCDSHFIPVKKHGDGRQHPLGKYNTMNGNAVVEKDKTKVALNLDQQACDAKDPEVFGHEIVIGNHQRAVPVAILYFK